MCINNLIQKNYNLSVYGDRFSQVLFFKFPKGQSYFKTRQKIAHLESNKIASTLNPKITRIFNNVQIRKYELLVNKPILVILLRMHHYINTDINLVHSCFLKSISIKWDKPQLDVKPEYLCLKLSWTFYSPWMTCNFKESLLINQHSGNNITKCHNISKVPAQITIARLEISKDSLSPNLTD